MIRDAFGSTVSVSHYLLPKLLECCASPRIVVEIDDAEIVNVHLTVGQAEQLIDDLSIAVRDAKAEHLARLGKAARSMAAQIAAAASDNLPVEIC